MKSADIPEVKAVEEKCRLSPWSEKDYRMEIDQRNSIALNARKGNKIVGFIIARLITSLSTNPELSNIKSLPNPQQKISLELETLESEVDVEIYNVGVLPEFRRHSIGKILLESLLKKLEIYKTVNVYLEVRDSNTGAIEFYTKQQFTEIGKRKNFYSNPSEDALVMKRRVKNS